MCDAEAIKQRRPPKYFAFQIGQQSTRLRVTWSSPSRLHCAESPQTARAALPPPLTICSFSFAAAMPLPAAQKHDVEEVIKVILNATAPRNKRKLADMFMDLPDKTAWSEYYEVRVEVRTCVRVVLIFSSLQVIPQPRCLKGIQNNLSKNKYRDPLDVFTDLDLVFLNALYYNEEGSQIANDAATLKVCITTMCYSPELSRIPIIGYARSRMETAIISSNTAFLSACFLGAEDTCCVH